MAGSGIGLWWRSGSGTMKRKSVARVSILGVMAIGIAGVAAASWHSVEEIHYLKTFYPDDFTVQDVFYASGVELIKVVLIALPLLLIIGVGLRLLRASGKGSD
jgi:hypothetical protein